ncbi:hypothetical protein AAG742_01965 [Micrococcus sp. 2A]|uniref:DUF6414 family protein n=1 Tax=Micrococcus sp. 2A TaxID=3142261 RepID=UPI00262EC2BF|nr:hypothetical protein [uncultured Micrococcus sp.]
MATLREFLYLDTRLVDNYLAQLEGGLFEESRLKTTGAAGYDAKLGIRISGAEAGVGGSQSDALETERTFRETPEARFNRLYDALGATPLDSSGANPWNTVKKGDFLDLECEVTIPSVSRMLGQLDQIRDFANLAKSFGSSVPGLDNNILGQIEALSTRVSGDKFVAEGFLQESFPRFAFRIEAAYLRNGLEGLEADLNVLGKVEGKWPEGERRTLMDLPGINLMSRKERREISRKKPGGDEESQGDIWMEGPGVAMSVIAIYR